MTKEKYSPQMTAFLKKLKRIDANSEDQEESSINSFYIYEIIDYLRILDCEKTKIQPHTLIKGLKWRYSKNTLPKVNHTLLLALKDKNNFETFYYSTGSLSKRKEEIIWDIHDEELNTLEVYYWTYLS